jgi:hypothetical protein
MTPGLICSHTVCTVTCENTDKRPGLAEVNGTRALTVAVSHTKYKQMQSVPSNPEPLRDMFKYA